MYNVKAIFDNLEKAKRSAYLRQWVQIRRWLISGEITPDQYTQFVDVLNDTYRRIA